MDNNNKRQNDGRKYNKRKGRVKIIKNEGQISKPQVNKAKKDRAQQLSQKAIKNIFGSGDNRSDAKPQLKAPVIQFINNTGAQTKQFINQ
jgi:hypothetical protein